MNVLKYMLSFLPLPCTFGLSSTFLINGDHDIMTPVKAARVLHSRLVEKKVPVAMHILPQTGHAFDLFLPEISPSAHNAFYNVERSMALMA